MPHKRREELFAATRELILRQGFRGTGLAEIQKAGCVARRLIYWHYESKDGLIEAVLEDYLDSWREWFFGAVEDRGDAGAECLGAFFKVLQDWVTTSDFEGCLALRALVEFNEGEDPLHEMATAHLERILKFLIQHARRAKVSHPTALARQLLCIAQGVIALAETGDARSAAREGRAAAKILVADALP